MYRNQIKNVVQYNREQPEFITQEQEDKLEQLEETINDIQKAKNIEEKKQYSALPKEYNYTYKKKKNKSLKETKIIKERRKSEKYINNFEIKNNNEQKLSIEEQIEHQRNSVKSQILNHN